VLAGCGRGEADEPGAEAPPTATAPATTTAPPVTETETTTEAAPKPEPPPGAPGFVAGYRGWTRLNDAPIPPREADPHEGTKNVFASARRRANGRFPPGTIVVKEATRPGADFIGLIATMRKVAGADPEHGDWVFVEYTREGPNERFAVQAEGAVCWSCHMGALESDYVFTR
jgi:hypothetical protein